MIKNNFFVAFLVGASLIMGLPAHSAEVYSKENPFRPSAEKLENLKEIIPNYPESPPMGEYTSLFEEKFVISNYPPGMFKYFVHAPKDYNPEKSYSAVLLLHNGERQMYGAASYFKQDINKKDDVILIVPIAPPGYDWNSAAPLALEALQDVAKNYKLDPRRLYVSGYAMGGIGVYSMLAKYKGIFAAGMSFCGTYDPNVVSDIDKSAAILIFHGQQDQTFPIAITRDIQNKLKASGHNVYYIEQSDGGHMDCIKTYDKRAFWKWLFKQKK